MNCLQPKPTRQIWCQPSLIGKPAAGVLILFCLSSLSMKVGPSVFPNVRPMAAKKEPFQPQKRIWWSTGHVQVPYGRILIPVWTITYSAQRIRSLTVFFHFLLSFSQGDSHLAQFAQRHCLTSSPGLTFCCRGDSHTWSYFFDVSQWPFLMSSTLQFGISIFY